MQATQTWLIVMSPTECERRLAETSLGRIGVIVNGHPEVFPVNHVVDAETGFVAFPTHDGTKLRGAVDWPSVAFEVDGIDANGDGWSVMVIGRAEEITDARKIEHLRRTRLALWGTSGQERWLQIVPSGTSGRRIRATEA
jgi:nitroimidazol reductase NimA-like FMN-containing flavoprotein (pyridoxamine 5'-phosphate oxidase superfamily)